MEQTCNKFFGGAGFLNFQCSFLGFFATLMLKTIVFSSLKISTYDKTYIFVLTSIPVPVCLAIGPPLDGWRWEKIESSLSETEWSSHSHHEEDSDKHDLLCPAGGTGQCGEINITAWLFHRSYNQRIRFMSTDQTAVVLKKCKGLNQLKILYQQTIANIDPSCIFLAF